jgi:hypothetical protein
MESMLRDVDSASALLKIKISTLKGKAVIADMQVKEKREALMQAEKIETEVILQIRTAERDLDVLKSFDGEKSKVLMEISHLPLEMRAKRERHYSLEEVCKRVRRPGAYTKVDVFMS